MAGHSYLWAPTVRAQAALAHPRPAFPSGSLSSPLVGWVAGLVHKSPEKRYDERGRILNRLVLKIDVASLPEWAAEMAAEEDGETQLDEAFRTLSTRTAPPRVPVPPREPPVHPTGGTWV